MSREMEGRSNDGGSRTMTASPALGGSTNQAGPSEGSSNGATVGRLRLRGGPSRKPRVKFTSDTVDNEGMGKKKSKICCIYHKPRAFDESSSESSCDSDDGEADTCASASSSGRASGSGGLRLRDGARSEAVEQSSSSESEGGAGDGKARRPKPKKRRPHHHAHDCDHGDGVNKYDRQPTTKGPSGSQSKT